MAPLTGAHETRTVLAVAAALVALSLLTYRAGAGGPPLPPGRARVALYATLPEFRKGATDAAKDLGIAVAGAAEDPAFFGYAVLQADAAPPEPALLAALRAAGVRLTAVGKHAPRGCSYVAGTPGYSTGYMAVVATVVPLPDRHVADI